MVPRNASGRWPAASSTADRRSARSSRRRSWRSSCCDSGWPCGVRRWWGSPGFVWLAFWWPAYRTPAASAVSRSRGASRRIPVRQLLRTVSSGPSPFSKIFFDPVWYFYIFWFPDYLKSARHFDMAAIGKYAWIPFAVAGVGNLAGGALSGCLMRRGFSVTIARKSAMTFFHRLMLVGDPRGARPTRRGSPSRWSRSP